MSRKTPFLGNRIDFNPSRGQFPTDKLRRGVIRDCVVRPISQQVFVMKQLFPQFEAVWDQNQVTWTGKVTPTPMSDTYKIRIEHSLEDMVRVWVIDPPLRELPNGKPSFHLYPEGCLCLYWPKMKEFTRKDLIAKTIVPWISVWLYYYELSLITGTWLGGGHEPEGPLSTYREDHL